MAEENRRALGRGLSVLMGETAGEGAPEEANNPKASLMPIDRIAPGEFQPRRLFNEEKIKELAESIREHGLLQPIVLRRPRIQGKPYLIIAGERRWRACKLLGMEKVPVFITEMSDRDAMQAAIIENVQRDDLTPLEEAEGYQRLMKEFKQTQEEVSAAVGKSRSHVANLLRLLTLPPEVQQYLHEGKLSAGHARVLIGAENALELANDIIHNALNVRETERRATHTRRQKGKTKKAESQAKENVSRETFSKEAANQSASAISSERLARERDSDLEALEESLTNAIGLGVRIEDREQGGEVIITFKNLAELDHILQRLTGHLK